MAAPSLQRSGETFRRSGSSGLVWEDRLLAEDGIQVKSREEGAEAGGGNGRQMERSRSNGGNRPYRAIKVSPAVDPPSPKVSGCGFCGIFGNSSGAPQKSNPRRR